MPPDDHHPSSAMPMRAMLKRDDMLLKPAVVVLSPREQQKDIICGIVMRKKMVRKSTIDDVLFEAVKAEDQTALRDARDMREPETLMRRGSRTMSFRGTDHDAETPPKSVITQKAFFRQAKMCTMRARKRRAKRTYGARNEPDVTGRSTMSAARQTQQPSAQCGT